MNSRRLSHFLVCLVWCEPNKAKLWQLLEAKQRNINLDVIVP